MQFIRTKQVDFSRDLPADIQSAYLRHTVQVQFEQSYMRGPDVTEPSFVDLISWCVSNCEQIFSATKWAANAAHFRFYLADDLTRFETHLGQSVDVSTDPAL